MQNKKELLDILTQRFKTYLGFDMVSNQTFNNPWSDDKNKTNFDALKMAELAITEFETFIYKSRVRDTKDTDLIRLEWNRKDEQFHFAFLDDPRALSLEWHIISNKITISDALDFQEYAEKNLIPLPQPITWLHMQRELNQFLLKKNTPKQIKK